MCPKDVFVSKRRIDLAVTAAVNEVLSCSKTHGGLLPEDLAFSIPSEARNIDPVTCEIRLVTTPKRFDTLKPILYPSPARDTFNLDDFTICYTFTQPDLSHDLPATAALSASVVPISIPALSYLHYFDQERFSSLRNLVIRPLLLLAPIASPTIPESTQVTPDSVILVASPSTSATTLIDSPAPVEPPVIRGDATFTISKSSEPKLSLPARLDFGILQICGSPGLPVRGVSWLPSQETYIHFV
ncbi:hypothetical protein TNCV_2758071 [Trichonephila clavipes]|nr:hypothetical protein TNCV_2758071 [Trichonephila clavipes]